MRHGLVLSLTLSLALLPGCVVAAVAAAAGAVGYVQYDKNGAYQDFEAEMDDVWVASRTALVKAGYALPSGVAETVAEDTTEARILGDDWRLLAERHAGGLTRVRFTIGTFDTDDHQRKAKLLLEAVGKQLE